MHRLPPHVHVITARVGNVTSSLAAATCSAAALAATSLCGLVPPAPCRRIPNCPVLALSAVATPSMWFDIRSTLKLQGDYCLSSSSIYRSNLTLRVCTGSSEKVAFLKPFVDELVSEVRRICCLCLD